MSRFVKPFTQLGQPYAEPATDRELIDRFHSTRDQAAFAALVDRHGPMVLGACRRVLRDAHAADDAFQATFLILAKKAGSVRWQESLGGWLHRVSQNVCRKAITRLVRKGHRGLPEGVDPAAPAAAPPSELSAMLDEELHALPSGYRDAIILCHLQGQTVDEAAKTLGLSDGQLRGRLHRGREKLRERLAKRGIALSITALAVALSAVPAQAVPAGAKLALAKLALEFVNNTPTETFSEALKLLTREGLTAMTPSKLPILLAASLIIVGVVFTAGVARQQSQAQVSHVVENNRRAQPGNEKAKPDRLVKIQDDVKIDRREGTIKSTSANGLVIVMDEDKFELNVELEDKAPVTVARRPVKVTELTVGMRAAASFKGNDKKAFEITAWWPMLDTVIKGIDAVKNIITVKADGNNGFEFEIPLPVGADAKIVSDQLPVGLGDLAVGSKVEIEFALDKKTVVGVRSEGEQDNLVAEIKSVDLVNKVLTLAVRAQGGQNERAVDLAFGITGDAKFRFFGKDITLADLKPEMPVRVKFAADRRTISKLWAAPPVPKEEQKDE